MRRNLECLDFVQINRYFFDKRAVASIPPHALELWQGLVTAIGQQDAGVLLVTDTLHKVLRRDSVFDLMSHIQHVPNYKNERVKRVAGCIVMTQYNNKTYRVDDIDRDKNPACTFETKEGSKTYADYYRVILARTIGNRKNIRSVATKVAVQLNCKLGGEAWCLEIPLVSTMVIGYDTYRDSSSPHRSAGAFVASINKSLTRWYSRVSFHDTHEGLGYSLASLLLDALRKYSQCNDDASPDRIIFFRDGVSDGQIPQVKEWEINQIVASLQALFPGVQHKLAFVVVTKHISTRFFLPGREHVMTNPLPGTVVDSEVTRPERYDFFLVSQSVRQGTVAPTLYNVIYDTTGLKPDHMQRLAYKLTHLYFNWPGTILVPAPCQYAHKLAFLAGQSMHAEHNPRLSSTLYYL
ncbi:hypothetical protein V5799_032736 [Amblyomma americanum]|uniref:Uncharacterized protein n=1 Tax=Amblyomma americanum TaxID=6943 RepID=A0AAQ4DQB6_AMBAM